MEQVALLAQQNTLPEPTLDLSLLSYSAPPPPSLSAAYTNNQQPSTAHNSNSGSAAATATTAVMQRSASISTSATVVAPPPDDPWMTGPRYAGAGAGVGATPFGVGGINGGSGGGVAPPSSVSGSGLPSGWWKRQGKVTVQFAGQQGFVLNRYMVYGISTEVRRYPFLFYILSSLIVIVSVGVAEHHSVVARCSGDTPNSRSCGIVWFVDIPSVYCRSCLPSELGVRDWNCLSVVWRYSSSTFSYFFSR